MEGLFRRCMGATFGLHLHGCGPCTFGVRVSCDWRKIQVLKLVVPKVKVVQKGTSLSLVYCISIVYFVFLLVCFVTMWWGTYGGCVID